MRLSLWVSVLLVSFSNVALAVSLEDSSYEIKWVPLTKPFEGDVRFLENFPGDPNSLLVLYWHALGRIQIKDSTWSQEVIVGKTSPGNSDGKGDAAGFYQPSSVRALNDTTVVISDSGNSCLKMVDLKSKYSRAHAGKCGKKDRMNSRVSLENARFGYPVGLLKRDKGVYIADRDNHALMLMTDNSVKQEAGGKEWFKFPTNLAGISDQVYISFRHGLARFSPDSGNLVKIIAGQNSGNLAGNFQNDMFKYPTSLVSVSNSTLLMADTENYRVAVISLSDQTVTTICTADTSFSDDSQDYCNPDFPYSIAIINSRILVGRSGGGIREIISKSLQSKLPATVSTMPKTMPTTTPKTVLKTTMATMLTTTITAPTTPPTLFQTTTPLDDTVLRSVGLMAQYDVDCSKLSEAVDYLIIDAQLIQYLRDFALLCKDCNIEEDRLPFMKCKNYLEIIWRTKYLLPDQSKITQEIPHEWKANLTTAVRNFQEASLKYNKRFLDLTLRSNPLINPPKVIYEELRLKPEPYSHCKSIELVYNQPTDRCVPRDTVGKRNEEMVNASHGESLSKD